MKKGDITDLDFLKYLISVLKNMTKNYSVAITEASNNYIYKEYLKLFEETAKAHRDCFNLLFKMGAYPLTEASESEIVDLYNQATAEAPK